MSASVTYQGTGAVLRDQTHIVFAQTMGYVAATAALFAAGAYLGRDLAYGAGIVAFIAGFGVLIGMRFAARKSQPLAVGLLGLFGVLIGLALAPTLIECGPGKVLTGLNRRIERSANCYALEDPESLAAAVAGTSAAAGPGAVHA